LVIVVVAVLVTLVSLVAVTWRRGPQPSSSTWSSGVPPVGATPPLTDMLLRGASGEPIPIGSLVPAVLLLAEGCGCPGMLIDLAAALPEGVRLLAVAADAPCLSAGSLRCLSDPGRELEIRYPVATMLRPVAIAVTPDGESAPLPGVETASDLAPIVGLFASQAMESSQAAQSSSPA
jgi:hypothetical protein